MTFRTIKPIFTTAVLSISSLSAFAHAATITVNSTDDFAKTRPTEKKICTLREAIALANGDKNFTGNCTREGKGDDKIIFDEKIAKRTITLKHGEIKIGGKVLNVHKSNGNNTSTLTIDGGKKGMTITVQSLKSNSQGAKGNFAPRNGFLITRRIFNASKPLIIENLTLTGGNVQGSGGAIHATADLTISNSILSRNSAVYGNGGAIHTTANLTINNSTLSHNKSTNQGGAIYASNYDMRQNSLNVASFIAGSLKAAKKAAKKVTVTNSTLLNNSAIEKGGQFLPRR